MKRFRRGHTFIEILATLAIILVEAALIIGAIIKLRAVVRSLEKKVGGGTTRAVQPRSGA